MEGMTLSLLIGFMLAFSAVWLTSRIHDLYTKREKNISQLLLRRAKKD